MFSLTNPRKINDDVSLCMVDWAVFAKEMIRLQLNVSESEMMTPAPRAGG